MRRRKRVLFLVIMAIYGIVCLFIGWLAGVDNGFDTGYRVAYLEMDKLLRQGIKEKVNFYIEGLDIKFFPGKDDRTVTTRIRDKAS